MQRFGEWLRRALGGEHPADELFGTGRGQERLYADLLHRVGNDPARAQRLIEYERKRRPRGNPILWLENAIDHWERDHS